MNLDISKKGKGYLPRSADPRDIKFASLFKFKDFSKQVDWNEGYDLRKFLVLKVEDQGSSGSCVGQAWSKYIEVADKMETGVPVDISSRDIYSRIFIAPDGGAYGYKGGSIIKARGVSEERIVASYDGLKPPTEEFMRIKVDTEVSARNALIRQIQSYTVVNPNIDEMAYAIKESHGLVFGVAGRNSGWSGAYPFMPDTKEEIWGHFLFAVGFGIINSKKHIIFLNSWSNLWGDKGYGYLSEDYFNDGWVFSGFTITDLPNDRLEITKMKDLIRLANKNDQYTVESGKKRLIPDEETLKLLVEEKIITGECRVVGNDEFNRFIEVDPWPSVKVNRLAKDLFNGLKDSFVNE